MELHVEWSDIKTLSAAKQIPVQYLLIGGYYEIWVTEDGTAYRTRIKKEGTATGDQLDFETNYKDDANAPQHPMDSDGKVYLRSESRPLGFTTVFTMCGDKTTATQKIGGGDPLAWDFSNADNDITAPTGFKRKRFEFQFIDPIHVKEGTFYFKNAPKGCYVDFYIVCPNGQYYKKNDGTPVLATADTPIVHYVVCHHIQGDCPMGDELNTEAASSDIPSNYKFWLEVTTPDTDSTSNGYASLEIYRERTVILE